jgi:hypothetical protein
MAVDMIMPCTKRSPISPSCSAWRIMAVSIGPGATAFTRTPRRAVSFASALVNAITAPLVAE